MGCLLKILFKPLTTHNFTISIPDIDSELLLLVTSTEFPADSLQEMVLSTSGEQVRYPTKASNQGSWSFSIPEYADGIVKKTVESLRSDIYNQVSGKLNIQKFYDVVITVNDLDRSYMDSGKPAMKVVLHGCFLTKRDGVQLSSTQSAQQLSLQYTFHYQWLEDVQDF